MYAKKRKVQEDGKCAGEVHCMQLVERGCSHDEGSARKPQVWVAVILWRFTKTEGFCQRNLQSQMDVVGMKRCKIVMVHARKICFPIKVSKKVKAHRWEVPVNNTGN